MQKKCPTCRGTGIIEFEKKDGEYLSEHPSRAMMRDRFRESHPDLANGVRVAISAAGGVNELARMLKIRPPSIHGWPKVPSERVLEIEELTDGRASRYAMRPDLYRIEDKKNPLKAGFMAALIEE